MGHHTLDRRKFLITTAAVSGAMVLAISIEGHAAAADLKAQPGAPHPGSPEFSAWLSIAADDTVTVRVPIPEIGNGAMTQGAMTVAEELGCDWSKIRVESASPSRDVLEDGVYSKAGGFESFFSGRSTRAFRNAIYLQAGASARERLKAAAAARWHVPVTEIEANNSLLSHTASGRTLRYGEVAGEAAKIQLAAEPALKPEGAWTLLGKATPNKLNLPQIVNGSAVYGMDVRLPNMVYAALRQAPVHGGTLKNFDAKAVMHLPGVLAVVSVDPTESRLGKFPPTAGFAGTEAQSAVAVIADHYWQARAALEALPLEWDDGPGAQWKTTAQVNQAAIAALDTTSDKPLKQVGHTEMLERPTGDMKLIEATYLTPYSEQAPMEPLNGTALVTKDAVEVWHPSQHPQQGLYVAADEAGVPPSQATFHQTFVGGAFGRRVLCNDVRMVVAVAKRFPGRPVHVIWTREETTRQGRYRPLVAARFKAALGADGLPHTLAARASGGPGAYTLGFADNPYMQSIANVRADMMTIPLHIMIGPYRGPGYNSFNFMTETFIDECAAMAKIDPLEYRLKLLADWPDKGWEKCLKEAASQAGWGKPLPKGTGQGIAIGNWGNQSGAPETGTTVAVVATVEVTQRGEIKVHTLDLAFDCGRIMNRNMIEAAMQGGAIFGYNMAMNEGLAIKNGAIVEGNFDTYPMARLADAPKINVHFGALTGNARFAESGEPPVGPIGPAIGNAIFKATGKRLRTTPFRQHDLTWV